HPQLRLNHVREGEVEFELHITQDHTNRLKIIHGGTIASLVDLAGSLAVASKGYYATGVSTDLNVSYLSSGGKVGDVLKGKAICDKSKLIPKTVGKTLAYTQISFWDKERNLVARGSHTKLVPHFLPSSISLHSPISPPPPYSSPLLPVPYEPTPKLAKGSVKATLTPWGYRFVALAVANSEPFVIPKGVAPVEADEEPVEVDEEPLKVDR
ncbi:HotDog domain-containing protein, partial [Staphylotrichum tortipilum]